MTHLNLTSKSKLLTALFLLILSSSLSFLVSCGSAGSETPNSIKFPCNFSKQEFLEQSEALLLESSFKITKVDIQKGEITATNSKKIGNAEIQLEVKAAISDIEKEVTAFAKFTTTENGKSTVAYYTGEDVPKEYQDMYLQSVSLLKMLCNNPKYPNRP